MASHYSTELVPEMLGPPLFQDEVPHPNQPRWFSSLGIAKARIFQGCFNTPNRNTPLNLNQQAIKGFLS